MGRPARVVLGRVVGAHGVRGLIRVRFFGDGPQTLLRIPEVALATEPGDPAPAAHAVRSSAAGRSGEVRMELEGIDGRDAAEALRGYLVLGDSSHLEPLPPGEHYWYELVGCGVFDGAGRSLGTVTEIWETGAHDVLVIETRSGRTELIPYVDELIREVDVEARRIVVEPIPGLLGTEARKG